VDDLDDNRSAQIVKLNNGQWAAVLGNGVNRASGQAVLLIQQLDAGQNNSLLHIPTNGSTNNGLGTPRLMDLDGNGTADIAYAGDLQGNLWSFDLTSTNAAEWSARFNKRPLFVARTAGNAVQPITAAPYVMRVPRSQSLQVAFGSGRLMDTADAANTTTQSLYSVRDNFTYVRNTSGVLTLTETTHIDNGRASLVAQTSNAFSGNFASTSSNPVDYASKRGWFLDLNQAGERHLANADVFQDSIVRFKTMIPSTQQSGESCNLTSVQGRFFSTYLDIFSGMPANKSVFGLSSTSFSRVQQGSAVELTLTKSDGEIIIPCRGIQCELDKPGSGPQNLELKKNPPVASMVDWRRLQ
jgi:type IV pilus assembly protein PilY1